MSSLQDGPKKLGKYEILEVIGRGGMGVVYKAVDPEIGRLVGIKMMTSAVINDPDLLKRFYREAQSSGKLQHPNIVTIYDLGVHEGNPYLVMEFLEGESLDTTIESHRAMSIEEKLNIAIQLSNALAYAHEHGIVHRDIKPGNVMLLKNGTVKIVDFGIARFGADKVTRTGQVMGSIQYMSPEQINGSHVDQRTDIFSAGVLLYQLLTKVLPFEGKETGDTLLKIIHGDPPPLSQFLRDFPPELETIVLRALAKDPEERYQTGTELALDLSHVQDDLKRERVAEYLQSAEGCIAQAQWAKAQELLLQVLKIDRQNARSTALLREVRQEIQKQQRSERAKDLRAQADQSLANGKLDDALRYLGAAVDLVPGDAELLHLRDSVKAKKATADQLAQLLRGAESSHEGGDLEEALATIEEAIKVDSTSTEAIALHAVVTRELAKRARLKQVQGFIDEARKQISSRRFTAALEVLKKAESLDPTATGVNELISLASTGQQQERRRKELEQITADVQEALNRSDHPAACARVDAGLRQFPDDRGLQKLKALADKEREAHEKRTYIESQVSLVRRLLEQHRAQEALPPLEEALRRYPDEFVLQTMHALVMENIEREQTEQFKTRTIQQAKEAIRRKAYSEAIDILQAAQRQTPSSEFEDLLQFAADEAAGHEKRLAIDAAAEQAHRLISGDEYENAIPLLEATLKKWDDPELRIILADAQRHLEEFNNGVQEAITGARRLLQSQRYSGAVKFMESQLQTYGKSREFLAVLEELRLEERRLQEFSAVKERVRDALASSNYKLALSMLEAFRQDFSNTQDAQLLQNEIDSKRDQAATAAVERALKDIRVLLLVRSYRTALGVLDRVAGDVVLVAPELRERYETLRKNAETALERERQVNQERQRRRELAERISDQPTIVQTGLESTEQAVEEQTQKANPTELQELLGEVTLVGQHYAEDESIQNGISDLREKLTSQLAELRQTGTIDQATLVAPMSLPATREATGVSEEGGVTLLGHQAGHDPTSGLPTAEAQQLAAPAAPENPSSLRELTPADINRAARILAPHMGPISGVLVRKAAKRADSLRGLYQLLAEHVEPGTKRVRFLQDAGFPDD